MVHLPAVGIFIAGSAFVFRYPLFLGYRFIGNSDRWSNYLAFVTFLTDHLWEGRIAAWSQQWLMGFDVFAQAYSFPTPLFLMPWLLGSGDAVHVFGWVEAVLFATTLLVAYWAIFHACRDRLASVAGACTYTCATYGLVKLAQNGSTYLVVLATPILFHLVRTADLGRPFRTAVPLTLLCGALIWMAFLQEVSCVLLFLLLYAAYEFRRGNRAALAVLLIACIVGVLLAVPRLQAEYEVLSASSRTGAVSIDYVSPATLPRFFDRDIYGSAADNFRLGPRFNLYEGNLLYSSVFGSLLLVLLFARRLWLLVIDRGSRLSFDTSDFLLVYAAVVFAVITLPPLYRVFKLLYVNLPFFHTRLCVSAMLPVALLTAFYVARRPRLVISPPAMLACALTVLLATVLSVVDTTAWLGHGYAAFQGKNFMSIAELVRFIALAGVFGGALVLNASKGFYGSGGLQLTVASVIVFQCLWGASETLSGPGTRNYTVPFEHHELVMAPPSQFQRPSPQQIAALHSLLDSDAYRSVMICPDSLAPDLVRNRLTPADCVDGFAFQWQLPLANGYTSGVPKRLGALFSSSGREVRYASVEALPWRLLSLLNVREAIVMSPRLFTNDRIKVPEDIHVVRNPSAYVYPRAYFASTIDGRSYDRAVAALRQDFPDSSTAPPLDAKAPADYIEGDVSGSFDASGELTLSSAGDRRTAIFPASDRQRFLILNEAYSPRWRANVSGSTLLVYPTNVVMLGVVVPAGATEVRLEYQSFIRFGGLLPLPY